MSNKNPGQIEKMAINKLGTALLRCDSIETYLSENDKTPSFDGFIFVYQGKIRKDNFLGRINVQVKGTETKIQGQSFKYQVEVSDLKNYRSDNGCVFFLVSLDIENDTCRIFYNCLQILDLNRILEKAKGQKSIGIELNEFPKDNPVEITNILVNFSNDSLKQRGFINNTPTLEELRSRGTEIDQLIMGGTVQGIPTYDIDLYITTHPVYVYAQLEKTNIEMPVDKIVSPVIHKTINRKVSINGRNYYDSYEIITKAGVREFHVGKSLVFGMGNDFSRINVNMRPKGYLSDFIKDTEFFIDLISSRSITFNGRTLRLSAFNDVDLPKYQAKLAYYKDVHSMLCRLGVTEDLDCTKLSENDNNNIRNFVNSLLYNSRISFPQLSDNSACGLFSIANLKIMIWVNCHPDGYYDLSSFYDDHLVALFMEEDCDKKNPIPASHYLLFSEEALSEASNLDCEKIYNDIIEKGTNLEYVARVQLFMLHVLNAYDLNIKHQSELLLLAQKLCSWISSIYDEDYLQTLNHLQIIKRIRDYNSDEITTLKQIVERADETVIKCGAYILLDDYPNAKKCIDSLGKKEQQAFLQYPIYHFVKLYDQDPNL